MQKVRSIFKPKRIGRPRKYAHHADGMGRGKMGTRYEFTR